MRIIEVTHIDPTTWSVDIHRHEARGHIGNPFFASKSSAQIAAEGFRFCFSRIGISVPTNYKSEADPVMPEKEEEKINFEKGMQIFCKKIVGLGEEASNRAIKAMLSERTTIK